MFHIFQRGDLPKGIIADVEFEGNQFGANISFFIGELEPGKGPGLHKHPYPETLIIHSGQASMVVDGQEILAGPGDIVVIGLGTRHRFTAIGAERLAAIAIHASNRFVIEWVNG